jgi:hypothetical protein
MTKTDFKVTEVITENDKICPNCKGIVYKANVSEYINENGMGFIVRLRKMKRLSCNNNCELCGMMEDFVQENISCGLSIEGIADVEHGKLYTIGSYIEKGNPFEGDSDEHHPVIIPYKLPEEERK